MTNKEKVNWASRIKDALHSAKNVHLVEFIHLVFTRTLDGVTVGDSGLCCCVPCLPSVIISLCLSVLHDAGFGFVWEEQGVSNEREL